MDDELKNPLHGKTLAFIIEYLVNYYEGFEGLSKEVNINCFKKDASVNSSLKFLRKMPWARKEVEDLFIKIYTYQLKKSQSK